MKRAVPVEVHDKGGNLLRIEFYALDGEHIIDALWDENDAQTPDNRVEFRKWAYTMVKRQNFTVDS